MKSFKLIFSRYIYIFAIITMLIAIYTLLYNFLKIFNIASLPPFQPLIDILSIVIALIIIFIVLYSLLYTRFIFREDKLVFHLSIFFITVPFEYFLLLRRDVKTGLMLLYYNAPIKDKEENIKYLVVNIKESNRDIFAETVKAANRRTIYELFDKEKEEKEV